MTCRERDDRDFKPFFCFSFIALLTLGAMPDRPTTISIASIEQKEKPCL